MNKDKLQEQNKYIIKHSWEYSQSLLQSATCFLRQSQSLHSPHFILSHTFVHSMMWCHLTQPAVTSVQHTLPRPRWFVFLLFQSPYQQAFVKWLLSYRYSYGWKSSAQHCGCLHSARNHSAPCMFQRLLLVVLVFAHILNVYMGSRVSNKTV